MTQSRVDALALWPTEVAYYLADTACPGLLIYKGKRRTSFVFFSQQRRHGHRSTSSVRIGEHPYTTLLQARAETKRRLGRIAAGRVDAGKITSTKFGEAFTEYVAHLQHVGKSDRWSKNVIALGRKHLLPRFEKMPLAELSANPKIVRDFHHHLTKIAGPVQANAAARVIRAAHRYARRLNPSLPVSPPTAAVDFNKESAREVTMPWHEWFKIWNEIKSPVRKSFAILGLLTGARPGELSRLDWRDIHPASRSITLRATKSGDDVVIPMSIEIVQALKQITVANSNLVFPSPRGGHIARFDSDGLPVYGHGLRHVYRTVCAEIGVGDLESHLLLGHRLSGVSRGYVSRIVMQQSSALRRAQAKISREIMRRLGIV